MWVEYAYKSSVHQWLVLTQLTFNDYHSPSKTTYHFLLFANNPYCNWIACTATINLPVVILVLIIGAAATPGNPGGTEICPSHCFFYPLHVLTLLLLFNSPIRSWRLGWWKTRFQYIELKFKLPWTPAWVESLKLWLVHVDNLTLHSPGNLYDRAVERRRQHAGAELEIGRASCRERV